MDLTAGMKERMPRLAQVVYVIKSIIHLYISCNLVVKLTTSLTLLCGSQLLMNFFFNCSLSYILYPPSCLIICSPVLLLCLWNHAQGHIPTGTVFSPLMVTLVQNVSITFISSFISFRLPLAT